MTYLDFNSRDTYLAARAAWRADYAELSAEIRKIKQTIKITQRDQKPSGHAQCNREYMRRQATNMLGIRQEMKEQSAAQWQARNAEKEAA